MDVDLSLDEIIAKNRKAENKHRKRGNFQPKRPFLPKKKPGAFKGKLHIVDARTKIAENKRAKIRDARDVLLSKKRANSNFDARHRLIELKQKEIQSMRLNRGNSAPRQMTRQMPAQSKIVHEGMLGNRLVTMTNRPGGFISTVNDVAIKGKASRGRDNYTMSDYTIKPRGYIDYDNMEDLEEQELQYSYRAQAAVPLRSLRRSISDRDNSSPIRNGFGRISTDMRPIVRTTNGTISPPRRVNVWPNNKIQQNDDPFGTYDAQRNRIERPTHGACTFGCHSGIGGGVGSTLSAEMRARLHTEPPDPRISHGIYANENRAERMASSSFFGSFETGKSPTTGNGYRIIVSNLHAKVTTQDIQELFSEIGPIIDARVVRPGTAEVIYISLADAERAVRNYHNRQLDLQPMHCTLVNPRSSNRPTAPAANAQAATTTKSSFQVDIDALHSVLFGER